MITVKQEKKASKSTVFGSDIPCGFFYGNIQGAIEPLLKIEGPGGYIIYKVFSGMSFRRGHTWVAENSLEIKDYQPVDAEIMFK